MPYRALSVGPALLRALLAALLLLTALAFARPAVAADTIDCTPMGDPACRTLTPVVECVWVEGDGSRSVVWGYDNPSDTTLRIDVGNKNGMSPAGPDLGQPTLFAPGRSRNAFVTTVTGSSASWRLGNNTASLSSSTAACATKPVPMIGNVVAVGLYLLVLVVLVPAAVRTRRTVPAPARTRTASR